MLARFFLAALSAVLAVPFMAGVTACAGDSGPDDVAAQPLQSEAPASPSSELLSSGPASSEPVPLDAATADATTEGSRSPVPRPGFVGEELVVNGSFEDWTDEGLPEGWMRGSGEIARTPDGTLGLSAIELKPSQPDVEGSGPATINSRLGVRHGDLGMKLRVALDAKVDAGPDRVFFEPNQGMLSFAVFVKVEGRTTALTHDPDGRKSDWANFWVGENWTLLSQEIDIPPDIDAASIMLVIQYRAGSEGSAFIDNVSAIMAEAAPGSET